MEARPLAAAAQRRLEMRPDVGNLGLLHRVQILVLSNPSRAQRAHGGRLPASATQRDDVGHRHAPARKSSHDERRVAGDVPEQPSLRAQPISAIHAALWPVEQAHAHQM
eukprot:5394997-Pyramimonas_sp.AAC.1